MCTLKVSGADFDVATFLANSRLRPCLVYERGKAHPAHRAGKEVCEQSGFHVPVSEARWGSLAEQCADAVEFLRAHADDLLRLMQVCRVDATLDFPVEAWPQDREVVIWSERFPGELVDAAGRLGLSLRITLYFGTGARPGQPR